MKERLNKVLEEVHDKGALIIKAAEQFEVDRCQNDLKEIGLPQMPTEYVEFLKLVNGFAWNGFEFFGTYRITVNKTGYVLMDIASYNVDLWNRKRGFGNRIMLGCFDDDLYCYNYDKGVYESLDNMMLMQIEEYDSFIDLFESVIMDQIDW